MPVSSVLDWSPDGCYAPYVYGNRLRLIHIATLEDWPISSISLEEVAGRDESYVALRWSPNGEWMALGCWFELPECEMYLVRPDGSESHQLTDNDYADVLLGWTEDGRKVLYWSFLPEPGSFWGDDVGIWKLHMHEVETGEEWQVARFTQPLEGWDNLVITDVHTLRPLQLDWPGEPQDMSFVQLHWTPDFRYLTVMLAGSNFNRFYYDVSLYWVGTVNSDVQLITSNPLATRLGPLSPDGRRLVLLAADSDERPHTYILDMETKETRMIQGIQDSILYLQWSPDSTMISFFVDARGNNPGSYIYNLATEEVTSLSDIFPAYTPILRWSPRMSYGPGACMEGAHVP